MNLDFQFRFLGAVFFSVVSAWTASAQIPEWIWSPDSAEPGVGGGTVYFRKTFRTPPYLWNSRLTVSADDDADVFLNGVLVARCERWERPVRMEVTVRLNQGENVIGIRAHNGSGPAGVLVHLTLGGERTVVSDATWLASASEEAGWSSLAFNAAHWKPAVSLGAHGRQPWGDVLQRAAATPAESLKVPPDFKVELLRSAELGEGSWVNLTFDDRGRLIISPEGNTMPILRLAFRDGNVDRVEPMAEALHFAMGLLWAHGGLYANALGPAGSGLYRLKDENGDDRFDAGEIKLLQAYQGGGEHGYHAVRLGPDGKIYVLNGNGTRLPKTISPHSAHRRYAQDVLALGGGENRLDRPAGYILRADPEGNDWELWMGGLRNTFDFDFNPDGELFAFDSDMEWDWGTPWYRPTRILHCVSGAEFGWREERRMWPDYYEDSLPAVVNIGIGSPTGVEFGIRSRFPEKYRQALFAMDWSYGRILAVFLSPNGASYRGTFETFLRGTPLNLTDLTFGPDGAMYFITGGRGTQSGLYRVSYRGSPDRTARQSSARGNASSVEARRIRRELEQLHGRPKEGAVDAVWPHLGSEDRFIRYAARIALESQDLGGWKERALAETNTTVALTALLALARLGGPETQPALLKSLARFPLDSLDQSHRLLKYRVIELSFARQGRPGPELVALAREKLGRQYPAPTWPENRELARLLTWLDAPDLVSKTLDLRDQARTHEEQLHYTEQLRFVRGGWTLENRRRYFHWWLRPRQSATHPAELARWFADVERRYVDGAWINKYLEELRRDAISTLSEHERRELASLIDTPVRKAQLVPNAIRPFVREWTMDDLAPHLAEAGAGRNFQRGRQAFADAQCLSCHRFGNDGGSIGPELTAAGSKYDRRSLLESILEPSKVINEQYRGTVVFLKDGDSVTGRLVSEGPGEVVLETDPLIGARQEIARKGIDRIAPATLSSMPAGLVNGLSREEILDLIAYLETNGQPGAGAFRPKP